MNIKEQLKNKTLSELFMLIRNGSGAMALSASEEIERRLSAQQTLALDGAARCPNCGKPWDKFFCAECVYCKPPRQ